MADALAKRLSTFQSVTAKRLDRQQRVAHDVAKSTALAVLKDRNKSWIEMLNRLDRTEREVVELRQALERLTRHVARLGNNGGE